MAKPARPARKDETLSFRSLRFGEYLVQIGRLTRGQLFAALSHQQKIRSEGRPLRIGEAVAALGLLSPVAVEKLRGDFDQVVTTVQPGRSAGPAGVLGKYE